MCSQTEFHGHKKVRDGFDSHRASGLDVRCEPHGTRLARKARTWSRNPHIAGIIAFCGFVLFCFLRILYISSVVQIKGFSSCIWRYCFPAGPKDAPFGLSKVHLLRR